MSWASTLCVLTHYLVAHRVDKLVCFEGKINMNSVGMATSIALNLLEGSLHWSTLYGIPIPHLEMSP